MKRSIAILLVLLLMGCSMVSEDNMERYFVENVEVSEDMKKIRAAILSLYQKQIDEELPGKTKIIKISCELFGKDNKKLDQEIQKNFWNNSERFWNEKYEKLVKDLKGTRLDLSQIVALIKIIEPEYSKLMDEYNRHFDKYRDRIVEIAKAIDKQDAESDKYYYETSHEDGLSTSSKYLLSSVLDEVLSVQDSRFDVYGECMYLIKKLFRSEVFKDSFLESHKSPILFETTLDIPRFWLEKLIPQSTNRENNIFNATRKAVSNQNISKQELGDLLRKISRYIRNLVQTVRSIQEDPVDWINWESTMDRRRNQQMTDYMGYSSIRGNVVQLMDKSSKISDFESDLDKLCEREAYRIYTEVVSVRCVYQEWRKSYYSKVKELFKNSKILADRLYEMVKDEEKTTLGKRRDEQRWRLGDIADVRDICNIGVEQILLEVNGISSQEEIKNALKERYYRIRNDRLKILNQE